MLLYAVQDSATSKQINSARSRTYTLFAGQPAMLEVALGRNANFYSMGAKGSFRLPFDTLGRTAA